MHVARSNRKKNAVRRKLAARKQKPLTPGEQAVRRLANILAGEKRYPKPPAYRYSYAEKNPEQPACYAVAAGEKYLRPGRSHCGRPALRRKR